MPKFHVDVTDKAGKRHRSQVEAATASALREKLVTKGYTVHDVQPAIAEPVARVAVMEPPSVDELESAAAFEQREQPHTELLKAMTTLASALYAIDGRLKSIESKKVMKLSQWQITWAIIMAWLFPIFLLVVGLFALSAIGMAIRSG